MKYAEGPWFVMNKFIEQPIPHEALTIQKSLFADTAIASISPIELVTEEDIANSKLIAAAPELLEALQGIIEIGKRDMSNPKYDCYFRTAKEAIKKATI